MSPKKSPPRLTLKKSRESVAAAVVVAEDVEAMLMASTAAEAVEVSVAEVPTGTDVAAKMLKLEKAKRVRLLSADLKELVAVTVKSTVAVAVAELAEVTVKRVSTVAVVAIEAAAEMVRVSTVAEAATEVVVMEDLAAVATTMVKTKMASRKSAPERTDNVVVVAEAREAAATEVVKEAVEAEVASRVMRATSRDVAVVKEAAVAATEVVLKVKSLL